MSDIVELSLVVPCYNDAGYLAESTARIKRVLDDHAVRFEIVFVEDHSTDDTRAVIEDLVARDHRCLAIYHERNKGRGQSFQSGAAIARGDIIGFVDIDLEVHERYIMDMVAAIHRGAEVATGRRRIKLSFRPYDLMRHAMSLGYASLYRLALRLPTRDPETGFKFFRRKTLRELFRHATAAGWFWDSEAMAYSTLLGFRIDEVPCEFVRRADKRSSVRLFGATIKQTRELLGFALRLRRRRRTSRVISIVVAQAFAESASPATEYGDGLPVVRFVEVLRSPIVAREVPKTLRVESRLEAATPGIGKPGRDDPERQERV
jgi:glycosyltransferase involved in cell wall biosynthesis